MEQDNSGLGDLQKYLKTNKRDLWLPKEPKKEIERGIWSENYIKKLHETLKVFWLSLWQVSLVVNVFFILFSAIPTEEIRQKKAAKVSGL